MEPDTVTVINATSVLEVVNALRDYPDARLIQGGTDMMVEVNLNRARVNDVI